ncbi:kinesin-like protein KIN-7O [Citrus sinensis]|uniref:Kinesin-like protein KIN-7O n=1 Tax=Citrus sinensis TaxID=2711 RepID=A0ACB8I0F0_CITSI|nr:kinesin-like protein KIN-7O [Citrus sinensis]
MERIHVTVRARPLSPEDAKSSPWRIVGNSIVIPNHSSKFEFDRIFDQDCKTLEVYEARTRDIVAAAVRGFNGTVFAYGQTNSGKTHTMRGSLTEPGVIPRAVHDLFDIIQGEVDREFLLRMSYMEIYNEDINDLLAPDHRKLQIHESLERGIYVAGLREEIVASPQQVLNLMDFGECISLVCCWLYISQLSANSYIRSSALLLIKQIIESRDKTEDDNNDNSCDAVRVSVLNLVDLAGSERAAKTGAEGVRLKEGSHINKSLMTLGTVIKKLSEGAESQGGHVPYRDSKLTRILQPALGGNANTAIICNITLAQIHADETKSSLQFASRALCVTNCARVNEASHSEHLEEEILRLRNTLLQSELERERIALELEEEKKAQAEREKVLQEQAKKIKNLSSMVLYSNRDENHERTKKNKRRDTWCPGNLSRESLQEVYSNVHLKASAVKSTRTEREMGPLLPFEELVNETEMEDESCKQDEDGRSYSSEDCNLPDPCALLNITSRRKVPLKKQSSFVEDNELLELQAEYEDLLLKFESHRTKSEMQIDFLTRKLAEVDCFCNLKCDDSSTYYVNECAPYGDKNASIRESEANLVIKQLQEKIKMLEEQKSSSRQNLDSLIELAMERDICASEKFDELREELLNAREEAKAAEERLASSESVGGMDEFKALVGHISGQQHSIICEYEKLHCCMRKKVSEVEREKLLVDNQSVDLQEQIQEIREFSEQQNMENLDLLTQIQTLENELSYLSSSSLAREKESLRKDLEKTKSKLKETECKLKNAVQEKTKLEGEKAFAEREVKRLHGQNTLLERDITKLDSLAGRRRDSVVDKTSKMFDPKRGKSPGVPYELMQEDYKKLEILAFEMETAIASLEEQLAAASREREEALSRNENLASELEAMSERFIKSSTELNILREEVSGLRLGIEESKLDEQKMQSSIKILYEEKEELAMQLTDSLLEMEEEKAIWSAKEKASIEAIEEKAKLYNAECASLLKGMLKVRNELESCREECMYLRERLASSEEEAKLEKKCRDPGTMAAKKVDLLEEKLETEIGSLKATIDERFNNVQQKFSSLEAMLKLTELHLNPPLAVSIGQGGVAGEGSGNTKLVLSNGTEGGGPKTTSLAQPGATVHGRFGGGEVSLGDLRPRGAFPGIGRGEGGWVAAGGGGSEGYAAGGGGSEAAVGRGRLDLGLGWAVLGLDKSNLGADGQEEGLPARKGAAMIGMQLARDFSPIWGWLRRILGWVFGICRHWSRFGRMPMDGCIAWSAISPSMDSQKGKTDGGGVMFGGKGACVVSMARTTTTIVERTVMEYRERFELLSGRLGEVSKAVLEGNFMKGLKSEIRAALRLLRPRGLGESMELAQMIADKDTAAVSWIPP